MSEQPTDLNGLPLEYERRYGTARRDLDVTYLINNPAASGKCSVFGLGLQEELGNVFLSEARSLLNHGADPLLVAGDPI